MSFLVKINFVNDVSYNGVINSRPKLKNECESLLTQKFRVLPLPFRSNKGF